MNEIRVTAQLFLNNGNLTLDRIVGGLQLDQAVPGYSASVQKIGAGAHEQIMISTDIDTPGYAYFRNLDDNESIQVGLDVSSTFYPLIELGPAEVALLPLADVDLYAISLGTGDTQLEWVVLEGASA
jgi:hypothetical protein